jgi:hypothetical protein
MLLGELMLLRESIGQVLAGDRLWSVCHEIYSCNGSSKVLAGFGSFNDDGRA